MVHGIHGSWSFDDRHKGSSCSGGCIRHTGIERSRKVNTSSTVWESARTNHQKISRIKKHQEATANNAPFSRWSIPGNVGWSHILFLTRLVIIIHLPSDKARHIIITKHDSHWSIGVIVVDGDDDIQWHSISEQPLSYWWNTFAKIGTYARSCHVVCTSIYPIPLHAGATSSILSRFTVFSRCHSGSSDGISVVVLVGAYR